MAKNGEIIIRFEEGKPQNGPTPATKTTVEEKSTADDSTLETAVMVYCLKKSANAIKNITIEEVKYHLNMRFQLTDNYLAQQNMSIALNVVNKVVGTGMTIAAGFKVAGPAGAIVAAGIAVANTAIDIAHNYEQERLRLNKMNAELSWNRQRAGYSLTAGSVGENR